MTWTSISAPAWRASPARLAPISSVSRSVMIVTRSRGWILRQVRTAFRAPGMRSSAYTDGSSVRFCILLLSPASARGGEARPAPFVEPMARFFADVVDDLLQVPGFLVNTKLAVRAGAVVQDPVYPLDLVARAELVHDVVHELEHFPGELAEGDLDLLAEVDQLTVDAVAAGPPLVLEDQRPAVAPPAQVLGAQLVELDADGLDQGRQRNRLVGPHRDVAHAELDRLEEGVRADVPPDLLAVIDAVGLDQEPHEIVELLGRVEGLRDGGTGEAVEDLRPEALQPAVAPQPEGGVRREGEQVREEVADLVEDLERRAPVLDADVDVEAENQVGAREHLHLLDDAVVARVGKDLLVGPVGEGVRPGGGHAHAGLRREANHLGAHLGDVAPDLGDVAADAGPQLDDRLVHLGLDPLLQDPLSLLQDLLNVGLELAGLRIDDLELFLDPEGEGGSFGHGTCVGSVRLVFRGAGRRTGRGAGAAALPAASAPDGERKAGQRTGEGPAGRWTRSISHFAECSSTQRKFSSPTEAGSASGAGFRKSIA